MATRQLAFDLMNDLRVPHSAGVDAAIEHMSTAACTDSRGAVFTRFEVVEFILDLTGYTKDQPLYSKRLLEPSFGGGDFLLPAIGRVLDSWKSLNRPGSPVEDLRDAIRAVELHRHTFLSTQAAVVSFLVREGIPAKTATELANSWLVQDDFLLTSLEGRFDFVVGNPPYVRQELIPAALLSQYRKRYHTMYDRADLYIPFMERSLSLLAPKGHLGFICSDRWMKNRYGGPLRSFVAGQFHLKMYVDMVDTPAFHSEVIAYPAITVISRDARGPTRIAHRPAINPAVLRVLADELKAQTDRKSVV